MLRHVPTPRFAVPTLLGVIVALLAGGIVAVQRPGDTAARAAAPPVLARPASPGSTFLDDDGELAADVQVEEAPVAADGAPGGVAVVAAGPTAVAGAPAPAAPAAPGGLGAAAQGAATVVNQPPPRPNRVSAPTSTSTSTSTPSPNGFGNAVHPKDFPDPFVIRANGSWFAYATQSGLTHIPMMRSVDLVNWQPAGDALRALPGWATFGYNWAPSVLQRGSGYVLYYSTRHAVTGLQCISRAASVLPEGPFVDASPGPLVCQSDRGGSIDPSPFVDANGQPWLLWKSEGTLKGEPTRLWSQRLTDDGLHLLGLGPSELLATASPWEGPIIEGPAMVLEGGRYHLLFSGNRWETASYAVGHAICAGPAGPCRRVGGGPIMHTSGAESGPGSPEVVRDRAGGLILAYHSWTTPHVGYPQGARRLHLGSLRFDGERAVITTPRPRTPA